MAEVKASLKNIQAEGVANNGAVKVIMNGDHEMIKIDIDPKLMTEEKEFFDDKFLILITAYSRKLDEKVISRALYKLMLTFKQLNNLKK